jgi:Tol biopolymer transport system component
LFPTLSPDGKTLAVIHKGAGERRLDSRICLVDVKTGQARPLGAPHDMAFPSWLPDGRGLILLVRVPDVANNRLVDTIARLDLDGKLTTLRPGSMPVVLGDGRRILFEDLQTRTWHTCNLEGLDVKPYADGLKGYSFPTPAPDGKRLLMMHFEPEKGPVPVVLPIDAGQGKPATTVPGLWAMPAWR